MQIKFVNCLFFKSITLEKSFVNTCGTLPHQPKLCRFSAFLESKFRKGADVIHDPLFHQHMWNTTDVIQDPPPYQQPNCES